MMVCLAGEHVLWENIVRGGHNFHENMFLRAGLSPAGQVCRRTCFVGSHNMGRTCLVRGHVLQ